MACAERLTRMIHNRKFSRCHPEAQRPHGFSDPLALQLATPSRANAARAGDPPGRAVAKSKDLLFQGR